MCVCVLSAYVLSLPFGGWLVTGATECVAELRTIQELRPSANQRAAGGALAPPPAAGHPTTHGAAEDSDVI